MSRRYWLQPRTSSIGDMSPAAAAAALSMTSASSREPSKIASACLARTGVGAQAATTTRACLQTPSAVRSSATATPVMAISSASLISCL